MKRFASHDNRNGIHQGNAMTVDEIRSQALQLPVEERELLAVTLLGSLADSDEQAAIDAEWAREIQSRSNAYRTGKTETLDADESLARVRQQLPTPPVSLSNRLRAVRRHRSHPRRGTFQPAASILD
jgi:putative addiction module component (TIGR02574 family)